MHAKVIKKERHLRSILKAVSWRFWATVTTIIISYLVTGSVHYAAAIGLSELIIKIGFYYIHERAWQYVRFIV